MFVKEDDKEKQGFYCKVCDYLTKDSDSWLDHLNGQKHNRLLGMNMNVERKSLGHV
jgi:U4/U6.U5 tri-snRNP component SNU23